MLRSQLRTIENMLSMGFVECRLLRSRAGTFSLWRVSTSSSASRSESAADSLMPRSQRSNSCNIFFASL